MLRQITVFRKRPLKQEIYTMEDMRIGLQTDTYDKPAQTNQQ